MRIRIVQRSSRTVQFCSVPAACRPSLLPRAAEENDANCGLQAAAEKHVARTKVQRRFPSVRFTPLIFSFEILHTLRYSKFQSYSKVLL
jgi:hypothetical protein